MHKGRLEAFSDGVFAIVITIMVLELKVPHGGEPTFPALHDVVRPFLCYALSFVYLGIYWSNHHHLLQASMHVNGAVLWANLHLLFWLSLFPFVTSWMGENPHAPHTVVLYGAVLILAAIGYSVLVRTLLACHGADSALRKAIGSDFKGHVSVLIYAAGIALAFWQPWLGVALYTLVALIWLVPDRRIERTLGP
jgi:uncharacterized membrane protein